MGDSRFTLLKLNFRKKIPRTEALVIVIVTVMSILLNIAYAVCFGAAVCALMFAWTAASQFTVEQAMVGETKVYKVVGPLYFASANRLKKMMDPEHDPNL